MNEQLKAFLEAKKEEELEKQQADKEDTLIKLGLFEKIYSPDDEANDDYPYCEFDNTGNVNKYYKKIPITVTDDEYEEIKKYANQEENNNETYARSEGNNFIATLLTVIAWAVYISGLICGIAFGVNRWGEPTFMMLVYFIAAFIIGTMYYGFAEIIRLLTEIKNK